jgi:hypothetical protein
MARKETKIQTFKKHIAEISKGANLIPGVYNYCDRWCERCTMAKHCSIYYMEQQEVENGKDIKNSVDRISDIFSLTMEMMQDMSNELGIDFNDFADFKIPEHKPSTIESLSNKYGKNVMLWLSENNKFFNEYSENIMLINEEKALKIGDCLETISWYSSVIGAKVHRSMTKLDTEFGDDIDDISDIEDQKGSAKVALISIDKSMEAFVYILNNIGEQEDESLNFLARLSKIRRNILKVFPDPLYFIRPGFVE